MTEPWREVLDDADLRYLGGLWGKSARNRGGELKGEVNLLVQHLFDALAVGELIWDHYLAPGPRARVDAVGGGNGRALLAWLCGAHDLGKASPAFQSQDDDLARRAEEAGLIGAVAAHGSGQVWRHEQASALILRDHLQTAWSDSTPHIEWIWPLVAGHHGRFPSLGDVDILPLRVNLR